MSWHGYILITAINLSAPRKNALANMARLLGRQDTGTAHGRNQYRENLDGSAAIVEAEFTDTELTPDELVPVLAQIMPGNPAAVDYATEQTADGELTTYSRGGIDYVSFLLFDGQGSDWEDSRQTTADYIAANSAAWEEDLEV